MVVVHATNVKWAEGLSKPFSLTGRHAAVIVVIVDGAGGCPGGMLVGFAGGTVVVAEAFAATNPGIARKARCDPNDRSCSESF